MTTTDTGAAALAAAREYETPLVRFLRDMIAVPGESLKERERCERVRQEYERLGFDEVRFDALGNVLARVGDGPLTILMDGHIDTVGVGDPASWAFDPFEGKLEDGHVWGRGAVDELPAIAGMAYGMKILRDQGRFPEGVTIWLCASVMEEDCDGLCMLHLIEKEGIKPDAVVLGEPTDMDIFRGHRGRVELTITARGRSVHAAHCDKGVNALYRIAPLMTEIGDLNGRLKTDAFLGKGTVAVTHLACETPSLNAVPDLARITLDRRLTAGETIESAQAEIRALPSLGEMELEVLRYQATSWRGLEVEQEKYFPSWVLPEEHPLVQGTVAAAAAVPGKRPEVSRWTFSTNGVATMGRLGIPTVGFAPGREDLAHSTEEHVAVEDLVRSAAVYAEMPAAIERALKK